MMKIRQVTDITDVVNIYIIKDCESILEGI